MIKCINLSKNYGHFEAVKNINLEFKEGKIIGLLGSNGSGKTTLIKLINGLLTPTEGKIEINGQEPNIESKKLIAYLPEKNYLDLNMKVSDTLDYFADFYENFNRQKALELLKKLNINLDATLKTLSKGTNDKVQLILVMSRDADVYILDEPIGGVDPAARDYILDTILNNFKKGATIIISTHLISDIEKILDEVIFIKEGEIVLQEDTDKLRNKKKKSIDELFREMFKC